MPLAIEIRRRIVDIALSWLLEGSFFDSVWSVIAVSRSPVVDCRLLTLILDTWFQHWWETCEVFDLPEGRKTLGLKHPVDGHTPLAYKKFPSPLLASLFTGVFHGGRSHENIRFLSYSWLSLSRHGL